MEELLQFFKTYETWIYFGLGVVALWQIRKFFLAWEELRRAAFGIERELAQGRLNQAAVALFIFLLMAVTEFLTASFVVPSMPGALPIPSPTLNLSATATATLLAPQAGAQTPTASETPQVVQGVGCVADQISITEPIDGSSVSGVVKIIGSVNIPNLGFYKYEIARPGESIWLPVNAGEQVVQNGELGEWITTVLPPGEYSLRLVVSDNQGRAMTPCVIRVNVTAEQP